jgi:hypothetical protein
MNSTEQGAPANPAVDLADSSTWNTGVAETLEPLVRRVLAPNPSPTPSPAPGPTSSAPAMRWR